LEAGLHFAQQITAGLVYLHTPDPTYLRKEPTVHRDLKPENVLLLEDGRVAITDFGLAKAVTESPQAAALLALFSEEDDEDDDQETSSSGTTLRAPSAPTRSVHTRRGQAMGTLEYMAPEQWASAAEVGPAADIYALGIMLSELLAGRHALLDLDRRYSSRQWQEAHERPATPSQPRGRSLREVEPAIPAEVEAIYRRCLAIEPDRRPTAAQVLAVLQQAAQERELEVYEPYEIAEHTPDNELAHWHKQGNAYFRFERYEQALVCNDRALELAPHDAEVLITRGNILLMLQRWVEAEAGYQQALSELPAEDTWHRAGVWNMFGVLYNASGRYGKAEAAYQQSLAVEPSKANTVYNRALNQRDWARAEEQAERRVEAVAHLGLARVHAVTGIGLGLAPCQQLLTFIEQDLARLEER
jgi:serine/threonine protein kinase